MVSRRRSDSGSIVLALLCVSAPACAPGPASAPSAAASECSAITDDPEELLLRYYRTSGSWCFLIPLPGPGAWYRKMVPSIEETTVFLTARFDPPDRVTYWHGCKPRKPADRRSVKLGEAAEGAPSTAEQLLQFLNPELLAQQELTLLPLDVYAPPDSCVLSGQLPTGEGITYVQALGDGSLRTVVVPTERYPVVEQHPVMAMEACSHTKCQEHR